MLTFVEQLSVAVTRPVIVGSSETLHSTVTLEAQVSTGGIVSSTVIRWVTSPKLPQSSVTRYTRVTVPGQLPTSTLLLVMENVSAGSLLSVAVPPAARNAARLAYAAGTSPAHWTAMFGAVMFGFCVSTTAMVCSPLVVLLHGSVAVHVRRIVRVSRQLVVTTSLEVMVGGPLASVDV